MMRGIVAVALSVGFCSMSYFAAAAGNPELGQQKAATCIACHGATGNSIALPPPSDPWPKLAGQTPEYITKQLLDFKTGRRENQQMSAQAQTLAEADIADIAAFFAKQRVESNTTPDRALLAQGQKLFLKGKGRPDMVAACVGCHGFNGAGQRDWAEVYAMRPSLLAPAIGGQHARYVMKQLTAFRDDNRTNDSGKVMHNVAVRLDDKEIAAVAEYVSTLGR